MFASATIAASALARRLDRPGRPRLLVIGLTLVIAGLLADAVVVRYAGLGAAQPALALLAAAVLGGGYGCCLVFGLAEVQRLAGPGELARMTAVFQAVAYAGYGAPYLLAVLGGLASAPTLLTGTAALAAATLGWTVRQARRTGTPPPRPAQPRL
ncbi:MAG TPA: hypothetical protein VF069_13820 [Streptosporangiaceae bacterium]